MRNSRRNEKISSNSPSNPLNNSYPTSALLVHQSPHAIEQHRSHYNPSAQEKKSYKIHSQWIHQSLLNNIRTAIPSDYCRPSKIHLLMKFLTNERPSEWGSIQTLKFSNDAKRHNLCWRKPGSHKSVWFKWLGIYTSKKETSRSLLRLLKYKWVLAAV